jgi:pyruvate,water dikinase
VFSANPITGSRDEVMINANWGLGESIVGGSATPDMYVVHKPRLEVSLRDVAYKERMTVVHDSGTADVEVAPERRSVPCLADEQVLEIARLAVLLEEAVGHAVDVECALARETLYLLQCRPITTLS